MLLPRDWVRSLFWRASPHEPNACGDFVRQMSRSPVPPFVAPCGFQGSPLPARASHSPAFVPLHGVALCYISNKWKKKHTCTRVIRRYGTCSHQQCVQRLAGRLKTLHPLSYLCWYPVPLPQTRSHTTKYTLSVPCPRNGSRTRPRRIPGPTLPPCPAPLVAPTSLPPALAVAPAEPNSIVGYDKEWSACL